MTTIIHDLLEKGESLTPRSLAAYPDYLFEKETDSPHIGGKMEQENVLEEANRLTQQDRAAQYGTFDENATRAIAMYKAFKQSTEINTTRDVAMLMTFLKLARESFKHKRDNIVDACGYLKLYEIEKS